MTASHYNYNKRYSITPYTIPRRESQASGQGSGQGLGHGLGHGLGQSHSYNSPSYNSPSYNSPSYTSPNFNTPSMGHGRSMSHGTVPGYSASHTAYGDIEYEDDDETLSTSVPTLSREFVVRRISEGEAGRVKEHLKCEACGKGYKHISSLAKHLWEHTPEWNVTKKLLISKHQQVQLLEAASILVGMNEEEPSRRSSVVQEDKNEPGVQFYGGYFDSSDTPKSQYNSNSTSNTTPRSGSIEKEVEDVEKKEVEEEVIAEEVIGPME